MMKRYSLLLGLGGLAMALGGAWLIGSNPVSEVNAAAGDTLTSAVGTGSGYGSRRTATYNDVKWVLSTGQSGYLGTNKADNHDKVVPISDDLPVVKAVNSSATTSTTGYYYYYTTTALANVGSVEFSYTAANNYTNAKAKLYIVAGDAVSAANGANYQQIDLAADSTRTQGYQISSNDGDTHVFTFAQTQSDSRYYGLVIELSAYQRYTGGTITLREGVSNTISMSNFEAIAGESSYTTYDVLEEDNFLVDGTRSDGAAISSDDYTVSIGSTDADGVYTKRTDVIWGTTLPTLEDNTIRFTSLYPSEVGGSEYPYADVTMTVSEPVIEGLAISGSMSKLTYNVGDAWDPSGLVVTGNPAGVDVTDDVTWSYSPTAPALGVNEVTVTATYDGLTADLVESVTVLEPIVYTQITSTDDLVQGMKLIITSGTTGNVYAMGSDAGNYRNQTSVSISSGAITNPGSSIATIELGISGDNFTLYDGGYLNASGGTEDNYLSTETTNDSNGLWSIAFDATSYAATVKVPSKTKRNVIRHNSDSTRFSCYTSGQNDIYLYGYMDQNVKDAKEFAELSDIVLVSACKALNVTSENWNEIKVFSADYSPEALAVLTNGTAGGADVIGQFLSRYDYIVKKYGYEDFLKRSTSNSNRAGGEMETSTTIGIAIAALAGILTLGAIALVYKRREN